MPGINSFEARCEIWGVLEELGYQLPGKAPRDLRQQLIVQLLSPVRLCQLMDCNTSGFPVLHYHLQFAQTHVH